MGAGSKKKTNIQIGTSLVKENLNCVSLKTGQHNLCAYINILFEYCE